MGGFQEAVRQEPQGQVQTGSCSDTSRHCCCCGNCEETWMAEGFDIPHSVADQGCGRQEGQGILETCQTLAGGSLHSGLQIGIESKPLSKKAQAKKDAKGPKCIGWREVTGCNPKSKVVSKSSCSKTIGDAKAGYCECRGNKKLKVGCAHAEFTCKEMCDFQL